MSRISRRGSRRPRSRRSSRYRRPKLRRVRRYRMIQDGDVRPSAESDYHEIWTSTVNTNVQVKKKGYNPKDYRMEYKIKNTRRNDRVEYALIPTSDVTFYDFTVGGGGRSGTFNQTSPKEVFPEQLFKNESPPITVTVSRDTHNSLKFIAETIIYHLNLEISCRANFRLQPHCSP